MRRGEAEAPKWQNREKLFQCKLKLHLKLFPLEGLPNCWWGVVASPWRKRWQIGCGGENSL